MENINESHSLGVENEALRPHSHGSRKGLGMADETRVIDSRAPMTLGRLGRYELLARVGAGGMAEVFRAIDLAPGASPEPLVIKTILPHLAADPEFQTMFINEARLTARFDHPNVVKVRDLGRIDGALFLAMELVDGCDLSRMLRHLETQQRTLPLFDTLQVTVGVLRGLHYAHTFAGPDGKSLGIVHRDVSPGNVLLTRAGVAKITDFGIAHATDATNDKTSAGTLKGKLRYMPPEQLLHGPMDARTDVFAVGMMLHLMLAGQHLFEGFGDMEIVDAIRSGGFLPPSAFNLTVPPELDAITEKATLPDPNKRFQSAAEFATALERFANARMSLRTNTLPKEIAAIVPAASTDEKSRSGSQSKSHSSLRQLAPEMDKALADIAAALPDLPGPKR